MADRIFVTVKSVENNDFHTLVSHLSKDDTFADVRRSWTSETGLDHQHYTFRNPQSKKKLRDEAMIGEILPPGGMAVVILAELNQPLSIIVPGLSQCISMVLQDQTGVEDIIKQINVKFGENQKQVRLLYEDRPLDPDQTLAAQGVPPYATLVTDYRMDITVRTSAAVEFEEVDTDDNDEFEPIVVEHPDRVVICHACEPMSTLLREDLAPERQRLWYGQQLLDRQMAISACLPDIDVNTAGDTDADVVLELSFLVYVSYVRGTVTTTTQRYVWPSDKIKCLLNKRYHQVFWEGQRINPNQSFSQVGIQPGALIKLSKTMLISVCDSRAKCHSLHVDKHCTVHDLRQMVRQYEENNNSFDIVHNGQVLQNHSASLSSCGVRSRAHIQLTSRTRPLSIRFGDETYQLERVSEHLVFEGLLRLANDVLGLESPLPLDTVFECECGRRVSRESEVCRQLPRSCCGADVLTLTVHRPIDVAVKIRDEAMQFRLPTTACVSTIHDAIQRRRRQSANTPTSNSQLWLGNQMLDNEKPIDQVGLINKRLELCLDTKLRLVVHIGKEEPRRLVWKVHPDECVDSTLDQMAASGLAECITDIAVRDGCQLHIRKHHKGKTFRELKIRDNQCLTMIERRKDPGQSVSSDSSFQYDRTQTDITIGNCSSRRKVSSVSSAFGLLFVSEDTQQRIVDMTKDYDNMSTVSEPIFRTTRTRSASLGTVQQRAEQKEIKSRRVTLSGSPLMRSEILFKCDNRQSFIMSFPQNKILISTIRDEVEKKLGMRVKLKQMRGRCSKVGEVMFTAEKKYVDKNGRNYEPHLIDQRREIELKDTDLPLEIPPTSRPSITVSPRKKK